MRALLHFDFPYYQETGDALRDEIGAFSWARKGSVKFVGSEAPADAIVSGTPKFGYRCLQSTTNNDYVSSSSANWSLKTGTAYEFSCWVRPITSNDGYILALYNGSGIQLSITLNSSLKVVATCSALGLSLTTPSALTLNTWHFVKLQLAGTYATLSVNLTNSAECSITSAAVSCSECRIGGINGQIDEFIFREGLTDGLPSAPMQGICRLEDFGGYGSGKLGNVTITANCIFNTTANINTHPSSLVFTVKDVQTGKFGGFAAGDEVMFIHKDGTYDFRTLSAVSGSTLTINSALATSSLDSKIIQVPNFNTLTVNSGVTVSPSWTAGARGLVAFRCKGNCTINGKIITRNANIKAIRTDSYTLTHAGLVNRFLWDTGGAIFITCGGTFSAGSAARLGSDWDGSQKGGSSSNGLTGGAGYGGSPLSDASQVGQVGYSAPYPAWNYKATAPGRTGTNLNFKSGWDGSAGTSLILITSTLNVDAAAISTGGGAGWGIASDSIQCGTGGGTGFCYIACERMA